MIKGPSFIRDSEQQTIRIGLGDSTKPRNLITNKIFNITSIIQTYSLSILLHHQTTSMFSAYKSYNLTNNPFSFFNLRNLLQISLPYIFALKHNYSGSYLEEQHHFHFLHPFLHSTRHLHKLLGFLLSVDFLK